MSAGRRRCRGAAGLVRLCLIAIVTALTYVTVPTISRAASTSTTVEALLIGDSVLDGLSRPYGTAGRDKLAARHSIIVDTAGCRRLIMTSCRVPPNPAPPNAISVMRTRAGQYNRALVIATGYNDETTGRFGIDASVEAIMAEARQQGIDHVIWLTYREAGTAGNIRRFKASNKVLRNRHDRGLLVADWAVRSAALPADWFSTDGIHLGSEAVEAMADLIGDALDRLPKPRPKPPSSSCSGRARARPCLSLSSAADAELRTRPTQHRRVFRRPAR